MLRNGYEYVKQKDLANGLTTWECVYRRRGNCNAKIKLNAIGDIEDEINEHTHGPSTTKCEISKVKANIKRKALTTQETAQQILSAELINVTPTAVANMPKLANIRQNICHCRQQRNILPIPQRREDVPVIPQE